MTTEAQAGGSKTPAAPTTAAEAKILIGAIVNNHFGVLTRVAELFAKRCYNIESLVVGVTDDPNYSRMTIVAMGDDYIRDQIVKQLSKLYDVHRVDVIPDEQASVREHMLVKIYVSGSTNAALTDAINDFGAKVIDFSPESITAEVTGDAASNDRFVEKVKPYGVLEICRAGAQALYRGARCL
ncbi:MAG: acetolactate synthase small subunit [Coriobacteriales bacterium]|jgi:acetolactate synthase-1/3 small subunit|nr:acetolactate synthase small subunit [Coriobacteriales bacterium]